MIPMADSITPANLPGTYLAYLAYTDGRWPTANAVRKAHPSAHLVTLTVTGRTLNADGIDCEPGNVNALKAAAWVVAKRASGEPRPVVYADLASAGYSMTEVVAALARMGVTRGQVRLLTAHYDGEHICAPVRGCKDADGNLIAFTADGTQWTDTAPGLHGSKIDMSILLDDFFGTVATMDAIPLNILGSYTDNAGTLYVIGTDAQGVLHESKRTAPGVWTQPYAIAGKTGA